MEHNLLVHKPEDNVGVAIADLNAGGKITGIIMDNDSRIEMESLGNIPLGHKIALKPIAQNEKIIISGYPCGFASQPIAGGEHVHVHNMKSQRWH